MSFSSPAIKYCSEQALWASERSKASGKILRKKHDLWVLFHGLRGTVNIDFYALAPNVFIAFLYVDETYHSFYDGNLTIVRAEELAGERKPVIYIERKDLDS